MDVTISTTLITGLVSVFATAVPVILLWLTQRAEFRKAAIERAQAKADTDAKTIETARVLNETANAHTAQIAQSLAATSTENAQNIRIQLKDDSDRKDVALKDIHVLVDGRLTEATTKIAELNRIISGLLAASGSTGDRTIADVSTARIVKPRKPTIKKKK